MLKTPVRVGVTVALSAAACGFGLSASAAPAAKSSPAATVRQFIDAFDKGDIKAAEATHIAEPSIVDEVPPHFWHGAGAFQAWAGDLDKDAKAHDQTEPKVTLGKVSRQQIDGDTAYVVVPATYSYKEKGVPTAETAKMVYSLKKDGGAWKISAWAWTGTIPHPVTPAAAAPAPAKP